MTDYSTAIFGLIAFTGVVSAAVVYILAQPSDLPVVKKQKQLKADSPSETFMPFQAMTTQDLLVLLVSFGNVYFAQSFYMPNQQPK